MEFPRNMDPVSKRQYDKFDYSFIDGTTLMWYNSETTGSDPYNLYLKYAVSW